MKFVKKDWQLKEEKQQCLKSSRLNNVKAHFARICCLQLHLNAI
jgi:hypothetical protein